MPCWRTDRGALLVIGSGCLIPWNNFKFGHPEKLDAVVLDAKAKRLCRAGRNKRRSPFGVALAKLTPVSP